MLSVQAHFSVVTVPPSLLVSMLSLNLSFLSCVFSSCYLCTIIVICTLSIPIIIMSSIISIN